MKSLYELVAPYDSVSLIGMCKNAGKTTTLNQLIAELKRGFFWCYISRKRWRKHRSGYQYGETGHFCL